MFKQNKVFIIIAIILIIAIGLVYFAKRNNGDNGTVKVAPIDSSDHVLGPLNAAVQMIVYSDFECPFCSQFADTIKKVKQEFGDQMAVAFRHYPLAGHPDAVKAAEASECAAEQDKFWQMHDKLFSDNIAKRMSQEQFKLDAADLGLNAEQFNQCLDSGKFADKMAAQKSQGDQAGVTGTPTSFINGFIYPGAYPFEDFTNAQGQKEAGLKTIISNLLH